MVDWINISSNSGNGNATITVTASSYTELLDRSTSLTVRTSTKSAVVGITQRFNNDFVVSPTTITAIPYSGASYNITITANANWSATTIPSWCSLSASGGTSGTSIITLTVSSNSGSARNDTLVFTCNGLSRSVSVSQVANEEQYYTIAISPSIISAPSSGGSYTISIVTEGEWTLAGPDWLTLSQASGSGNATVTVTIGPNTNEYNMIGTIIGQVFGDYATCSIRQEGYYVGSNGSISPSSISLPFYETSTTIYVTSNVAWTLSIQQQSPHYLSVSPSSGMSGTSIPVTLTAIDYNHSYSSRTTNIVLQNANTTEILDTATVTQASREQVQFSISNNYGWAEASGGTIYIPYSCNVPIEIGYYYNNNSVNGYPWSCTVESNRIVATCGAKTSCGVDTAQIEVATRAFGVYEVLDYIYLVQDPACFYYMSGTNIYNVSSTSEPTELMQLNKAFIRSFKVDGVDVSIDNLICEDAALPSVIGTDVGNKLKYTFGSTGNHTVVFACVYPPMYQPAFVENAYVNEIPLVNLTYDANGSNEDLPSMRNILSGGNTSIGISGLTAVTMTLNALWCSACDDYYFAPFDGMGYPYTYNLHIPDGYEAVYHDTFDGTNATDLWFDGQVAPDWYGTSSGAGSKFDGLAATGTAHAPSGSDYSEIASHLPSGWTLVYDA